MRRAPAIWFLAVLGLAASLVWSPAGFAAGAISRNSINLELSWEDASGDELGFVIERAPSAKGPWRQVGYVGRNITSFLETNLKARTTYFYRVFAFSEDGASLYSNVALVTTPAAPRIPWITRQPMNTTLVVGSEAAFSVLASGTPPLAFQWRWNGKNLEGETAPQLKLPSIQPGHAGYYSVILSNAQGVTASYAARLIVTSPLGLEINGAGKVAPDLNGKNLELGRRYAIRAYPARGCAFRGWMTNGVPGTLSSTLSFVMETNLNLRARFSDVTRPLVIPRIPTPNARVTNSVLASKGAASDNLALAEVRYQVNDGDWRLASGTTNWEGQVELAPGRNALRVYAVDAAGLHSLTNTRYLTRVVNTPLVVRTNGWGYATPNYHSRQLEIGRTYTMTAVPGNGFVFTNWSISTPANLPVLSPHRILSFPMESNLVVQANFVDVQRPTLTVTNPLPRGRIPTPTITLGGRAADNDHVTAVMFQLNQNPWMSAEGTHHWLATLDLEPGTNIVRAFCLDGTGNRSLTNSLKTVVEIDQPSALIQTVGMPQRPVAVERPSLVAPLVSGITLTGGTVAVWFWGAPGVDYALEYANSLNATGWMALPETVAGQDAPTRLVDPHPTSPQRFYRLRANLLP